MKLYVKIIAISEEDGLKATREELVEIPAKVLRLNEVVMGSDVNDLLTGFATSAFAAAVQTVKLGGQSPGQSVLTGEGGGPIGGRVQEQAPGGGGQGAPKSRDGALAQALGLDIIEAMDQKERGHRQIGPGPIGYGNSRGR